MKIKKTISLLIWGGILVLLYFVNSYMAVGYSLAVLVQFLISKFLEEKDE